MIRRASAIRSAIRPNLVFCILGTRRCRFVRSLPRRFPQSVSALWLPHQKILEDQIPFAAGEWSAATTALYLAINGVGSGFDFDHAIKCVAGRAMERGRLVRSHDTPPTLVFLLGLTYIPLKRWQIVSCDGHQGPSHCRPFVRSCPNFEGTDLVSGPFLFL
jgi:hypothetical protein